ncbi:MAG: hypothetical protein J5980_07280 [Muribaculaceae bacterium]|nr:hypothetical protein [Muribaculaceae bacterium]
MAPQNRVPPVQVYKVSVFFASIEKKNKKTIEKYFVLSPLWGMIKESSQKSCVFHFILHSTCTNGWIKCSRPAISEQARMASLNRILGGVSAKKM